MGWVRSGLGLAAREGQKRFPLKSTCLSVYSRTVNTRAPLLLIQAAYPHLKATRGAVLNIGSINAYSGEGNLLAYSISKGGLMTLSRNLADALCYDQIRVNHFNVGWVLTPNEYQQKIADGLPDNWPEPDDTGVAGLMNLSIVVLLIFPLLMAFAAASDLLTMRISNVLVLVVAGAFFVLALFVGLPWPEIGLRVGVAALVLVIAFALFAFGWIGGGDAKLTAAITLWIDLDLMLAYYVYAALLGGGLTLLILAVAPLLISLFWPFAAR